MIDFLCKYYWVALTTAKSNLAYLGEVVTRTVFLAAILYIFLRLWQVTYAQCGATRLGGLSLSEMLWYLVITESIFMSTPRITQNLDEDVRTGTLVVQLVRPLSYPLYYLAATMGERAVRFFMILVVGSVIALAFVGPISMSLLGLLIFVASLPLAFSLDFLGYFLVGLGAFWLEDTSGILLIYQKTIMLAGGLLLPVELFPDALKPVVKALPFSSIVYGPAHLFVHPDWQELGSLILKQGLAIFVFALLVWLVYRLAMQRVQATGG